MLVKECITCEIKSSMKYFLPKAHVWNGWKDNLHNSHPYHNVQYRMLKPESVCNFDFFKSLCVFLLLARRRGKTPSYITKIKLVKKTSWKIYV